MEGGELFTKTYYLAGDIGGTKTVLALFSEENGPFQPIDKEQFPSSSFSSLDEIVEKYLAKHEVGISGASFGVAGPVEDERADVTNLPWVIDTRQLSSLIHNAPVQLLNDLSATAHAVPYLSPTDVYTIVQGEKNHHHALGVIAPGTGLGESFLIWNGTRYEAHPSEGGHASFAPTTQVQLELLEYLLPKLGHVSYEAVCSGRAIPNLYGFFRDVGEFAEPGWLQEALATAIDPTRVILQAAIEAKAEICLQTLDLFLDILASEAGNLALKVMATGGIYIGGGIPPRLLSKIEKVRFGAAFKNKGRFSSLLAKIPVHVIVKPEMALFGAACHGFEQLETT
jgi:glucokinase